MIQRASSIVNALLVRQQPAQSMANVIKAGVGGLLAIGLVAWISRHSGHPLLMAPFGATCVLLFSLPASPLSQPVNVIAGHLISTAIGLLLHTLLPDQWWSLGIAVGLAIAAMAAFRVTHPPAGADPLVVFFENTGWDYLVFPVALGSVALVLVAWLFHRIPPQADYPLK